MFTSVFVAVTVWLWCLPVWGTPTPRVQRSEHPPSLRGPTGPRHVAGKPRKCESHSALDKKNQLDQKETKKITLAKYEFALGLFGFSGGFDSYQTAKSTRWAFGSLKKLAQKISHLPLLSCQRKCSNSFHGQWPEYPWATTKIRTSSPHWNWSDLDAVGSPCWQARVNIGKCCRNLQRELNSMQDPGFCGDSRTMMQRLQLWGDILSQIPMETRWLCEFFKFKAHLEFQSNHHLHEVSCHNHLAPYEGKIQQRASSKFSEATANAFQWSPKAMWASTTSPLATTCWKVYHNSLMKIYRYIERERDTMIRLYNDLYRYNMCFKWL